jgi:hypothetical protein
MTTTYRALIHCNEQKSPQCAGLREVAGDRLRDLDEARTMAGARGWLRAYGPAQTYDVCPACRPYVATEHGGVGVPPRAAAG